MEYAGFWRRFAAYWVDIFIMLPLVILSVWGPLQSLNFVAYYFLPGLAFGLWYHVYLVKKYGGTPGKLIMKVKVVKTDGSDVGYKEAFLRYLVLFVVTILSSIASIMAYSSMDESIYFSLDWQQKQSLFLLSMPLWFSTVNTIHMIWVWSEFIVMMTNKRRRALHDFMAGTVVIKKSVESIIDNQAVAAS